ncbi:MAG: DNA mismatch repair protein MutS [Chlorobiota bacterium]
MSRPAETPLMRQYRQIKQQYPDTIVLFRLGDFYETFEEDAAITARVCGITLTRRNNGAAGDVPMAGFPHHQLDTYLPKLVRAGYRVAVCEQLEDPKLARGIVRRGVIEVVTPGVALYDKLLEAKQSRYVAALALPSRVGRAVGIAIADASTGEFFVAEVPAESALGVLEGFAPAEILVARRDYGTVREWEQQLIWRPTLTRLEDWLVEEGFARQLLQRHFGVGSLKGFGVEHLSGGLAAAGAVLHYIRETQQEQAVHLRSIRYYAASEYMELDAATRRNLELLATVAEGRADGSLWRVLDKTLTPMGGRLLKFWLHHPLRRPEAIRPRLAAVRVLCEHATLRQQLRQLLPQLGDIERLLSRIATKRALPREYLWLGQSIAVCQQIVALLRQLPLEGLFGEFAWEELVSPVLPLGQRLRGAFQESPASEFGRGAIFRPGFSPELDELQQLLRSSKEWLARYQESERQRTGIPSLKVGYNAVFGYYIEVTHAHRSKVPLDYERKQTLTNAERYTTPVLKEMELKLLNAEQRIAALEQELLEELRQEVLQSAEQLQAVAKALATLDCLQSLAEVAQEYGYTEPEVDESEVIEIRAGRHPVVERLLPAGEQYVPNDTYLDTEREQLHVVTGPNMSGKSCYLRQVGLIVLLAQIGSFVPAQRARIGVVDRIFTRVGAHDNITGGESTFLVEMHEAAAILHNATRRSLILLDEVGRGTATFDGISIAWAIAEYIHEFIRARTLFATHYHELNVLAERYPRIRAYHAEVREVEGKLVFTHRIVPGGTDHSFGIHVAQMAGIPEWVIRRAEEIMAVLEAEHGRSAASALRANVTAAPQPVQLSIFTLMDDPLREQLRRIDPNTLTPLQALQVLAELCQQARQGS